MAKMRKCQLTAETFEITYDAFRASFGKHAKGYDNMKVANSIGHVLESMSIEAPRDRDKFRRALSSESSSEFLLDARQFDMLRKMVEDDEIPWTHHSGPNVQQTIESVRAWPEVEVEEKK